MNANFFPYKDIGATQRIWFANQAKKLRTDNGLTIAELADKLDCCPAIIQGLENPRSNTDVTLEMLLDYCRLFEVTPNDLLLDPKAPNFQSSVEDLLSLEFVSLAV